MYKIAVIGSGDCVIGFKALGLETFAVENPEEAKAVLHKISKPDEDEYAIIYIEEDMAQYMMDVIRSFDDKPSPAIILIPGRSGSLGLGESARKAAVEKAVGSDIL